MAELRVALGEVLVGLGEDVTQVSASSPGPIGACVASPAWQHAGAAGPGHAERGSVAVDLVEGFSREVSALGYHGTGDLEVLLGTERDLTRAHELLRLSYATA